MKNLAFVLVGLFSLVAAGLSAEVRTADRCTVEGPERFACVANGGEEKHEVFVRDGPRSHWERIPGPLVWPLRMGTDRGVVLARGVPTGTEDRVRPVGDWPTWWTRLIALDGTVLSFDGPHVAGLSEKGDWLAVQLVEPAPAGTQDLDNGITEPAASSNAPLVVYRWDGSEARRLPGLRVFQRYPEDEDDGYSFSGDGRAILIYRAEHRTFDVYSLDGSTRDETLLLSELAEGFAAREFRFVEADLIVMWQFEMFGRETSEWLRVVSRSTSGKWVSRSIVHEDRYTDLRGISSNGRLLLRGDHGFDLVNPFGRLIWRVNSSGWSDLAEVMPGKDLQRWQPALLPGGDVVLRKYGSGSQRAPLEKVVVRLSRVEENVRSSLGPDEPLVVFSEDQPLSRVWAIAEVPGGAAVDGSGRYALFDPSEGTRRVKDTVTRDLPEK